MAIVSISIKQDMLGEVDNLRSDLGFSGRSDVVRAGLRNLIAENRENRKLSGRIKSVLLLVHDRKSEQCVTDSKHAFEDIIATHMHTGLRGGKCMELFVLEGNARRIRLFFQCQQKNRHVEYVKLVTP